MGIQIGPVTLSDSVVEHCEVMPFQYGGSVGVRMARRHLGWYVKGLAGAAAFRAALNRDDDPKRVTAPIRRVYDSQTALQEAA